MESKIFIDIHYASRSPQITIIQKDSDDPRDKLIAMLLGEAMPGIKDGYCQIERYSELNGNTVAVITPINPIDMLKHLSAIIAHAEENACIDKVNVPEILLAFFETHRHRLPAVPVKIPTLGEELNETLKG